MCLALAACDSSQDAPSGAPASGPSLSVSQDPARINAALEALAASLANALGDADVRGALKAEALRKFDGDYDVLYGTFASRGINGSTFRSRVAQGLERRRGLLRVTGSVDDLAARVPRLNIAVPVHAEAWDAATYAPLVAFAPVDVDDMALTRVKAFDAAGNVHWLDAQTPPDRPVVVVGINERTDDAGQVRTDLVPSSLIRASMQCDPTVLQCEETGGGTGGGMATNRVAPHAETLYQINIDDDSEGWFSGDCELYLFVNGSPPPGAAVYSAGVDYPGRSWQEINRFLFNWIPSNIGQYTIVFWVEEDPQTLPAATYRNYTSGGYTWSIGTNDDPLGTNLVNFTDPLSQVYNNTHLRFQFR